MNFPIDEVRKRIKQIAYEANRNSISPYSFRFGTKAAIFTAQTLDNKTHIGWAFCPINAVAGDRFHYDHGAGINKNEDGQYLWVAPLTAQQIKEIFSNPEKFVGSEFKGIVGLSDGTQKMSTLRIPQNRLDLPVDIYLGHDKIENPDIIKSISNMPSESLDIWSATDKLPDHGSKILSWDSEKLRQVHSGPYLTLDTFDRSGKSNMQFQNYHGSMVGTNTWVSRKSWAYFKDVCDITMGNEFASMITDQKITNEPDYSSSQP